MTSTNIQLFNDRMDMFTEADRLRKKYAPMHLTGSYFFGNQTVHSDIDYITHPSNEIGLLEDGYERFSESDYKDSTVIAVLRKRFGSYHIDVQLCREIDWRN